MPDQLPFLQLVCRFQLGVGGQVVREGEVRFGLVGCQRGRRRDVKGPTGVKLWLRHAEMGLGSGPVHILGQVQILGLGQAQRTL